MKILILENVLSFLSRNILFKWSNKDQFILKGHFKPKVFLFESQLTWSMILCNKRDIQKWTVTHVLINLKMLTNWHQLAKRMTTCIEGHVWYVDQIVYGILNYIYFSILITSVRWLTTVFARLSHACDDCLSDVSITCACKIDLCNPKKKQNPLQHLNWIHSDSFKHCLNIIMFMTGTNNIMIWQKAW